MARVLHNDNHTMDPPSSFWVRRLNFFEIKVEEKKKKNQTKKQTKMNENIQS